uniref:Uncharacterized protein n=1 Tax=Rhizophora mucronata TaxID=61149 RepID=A0A2P2J771_RHIMU
MNCTLLDLRSLQKSLKSMRWEFSGSHSVPLSFPRHANRDLLQLEAMTNCLSSCTSAFLSRSSNLSILSLSASLNFSNNRVDSESTSSSRGASTDFELEEAATADTAVNLNLRFGDEWLSIPMGGLDLEVALEA